MNCCDSAIHFTFASLQYDVKLAADMNATGILRFSHSVLLRMGSYQKNLLNLKIQYFVTYLDHILNKVLRLL